MCKTHAVLVYTGPKLLLLLLLLPPIKQEQLRDSADFSTRGHEIPIS
jgi:hypothetical protein